MRYKGVNEIREPKKKKSKKEAKTEQDIFNIYHFLEQKV